jgi:hypothetical protein
MSMDGVLNFEITMACASFRSLRLKRGPALMAFRSERSLSAIAPNEQTRSSKHTAGKKIGFGILPHGTLGLLNAALKAWELRNGLRPLPSAWERNPHTA